MIDKILCLPTNEELKNTSFTSKQGRGMSTIMLKLAEIYYLQGRKVIILNDHQKEKYDI